MLAYDFMAAFVVPYFLNSYALEVEDRWVDFAATGMNLFKYWSKISLQQEILLRMDSYDHCVNDEDIFSF